MKILLVHNAYQQRGGEDAVFDDEARLLADHGHELRRFTRHNDEIGDRAGWQVAVETVWSRRSAHAMGSLIDDWHPDVVHVHNTFPLVSPAVIWAAARRGAAVVATLHNFRLACLEGTFMRDGRVCERCLGHAPWRGVVAGCYRGSRPASAVLAASTLLHRGLGTWRHQVHRFIALNESSAAKFVLSGLPADRIRVKPNFAWPVDPATDPPQRRGGLFVGRMTADKGVGLLADALRQAALRQPPLVAIGSGPAQDELAAAGAEMRGQQTPEAVRGAMQQAAWLVVPSVAQEQFPRVLAEAYAAGLPVIAAARGSLASLVEDGRSGLLFRPDDAADLASKLAWAEAHPVELAAMGRRAREVHGERFGPRAVYDRQLQIYDEARQEAGARTDTGHRLDNPGAGAPRTRR